MQNTQLNVSKNGCLIEKNIYIRYLIEQIYIYIYIY